jgi:putative hydrolase of the HAD superfamily
MIGNSPRSDINPALTAGLNAVFIPHSATWHREVEEILRPDDPARLLIIECFTDLERYF